MRRRYFRVMVAAHSAALCTAVVAAPMGWRGDGTGRYPGARPPPTWQDTTNGTVNVVWKTRMPDWSNASPIVVGDRIFVCAEPDKLICVSADDGRILWERANPFLELLPPDRAEKARELEERGAALNKEMKATKDRITRLGRKIGRAPDDPALKEQLSELQKKQSALKKERRTIAQYVVPEQGRIAGYSTPTPTSDGTHVYALFATGAAVCYDLEGNRKWGRIVEIKNHKWGHSASPLLVGDKLLVQILNLIALDTDTGETVWERKTPWGWCSPVHVRIGGADAVLTGKGALVRVADGEVIMPNVKRGGDSGASPVVHDGVAYLVAGKGITAVQLPDTLEEKTKQTVLWKAYPKITPKKQAYYQSPVYHDGVLYAIASRLEFWLSAIDAGSGEIFYTKRLMLAGKRAYPSITLAGNVLHVASEGVAYVFEPGREYKQLAENRLENYRSCPVFAGDRMYVRGLEHLYCIGGPAEPGPGQ